MKLEILIFGITAFLLYNAYYDGKYIKMFLVYKKYYKMAFIGFLALCFYIMIKRNPLQTKNMLLYTNNMIKYNNVTNNTNTANIIVYFVLKKKISCNAFGNVFNVLLSLFRVFV